MSKQLPEHMKPITDFHMYGVPLADMDREDLLKVIQWLVNQMNDYKADAEKKGSMMNDYLLGKLKV